MNLNELCDEVNRILKDQKITALDARTSPVVSPRNVRYYQTIGLLHPPTRQDGRANYDASHVEKLVSIKRAQHDGVPLEQLQPKREPLDIEPILAPMRSEFAISPLEVSVVRNIATDRAVYIKKDAFISNSEPELGWSIHFGDFTLSGRGTRPSQEQVDAIRKILQADVDTDDN